MDTSVDVIKNKRIEEVLVEMKRWVSLIEFLSYLFFHVIVLV